MLRRRGVELLQTGKSGVDLSAEKFGDLEQMDSVVTLAPSLAARWFTGYESAEAFSDSRHAQVGMTRCFLSKLMRVLSQVTASY